MSDNIIQLNEDLIKHDLKDDRVNLLSVGECNIKCVSYR